jgi:purine-binding chemotaxis protein CheW
VLDVPLEDRMLSLGLVADRVIEVITLRADQIEPAPDIGVPWRSDYISGVVRRETASSSCSIWPACSPTATPPPGRRA